MAATRLDLAVLEDMARVHIFYEVDRLALWSRRTVDARAFGTDPDAVRFAFKIQQATLESALLHMRVLIEFILKSPPTNPKFANDVVADDYFDSGGACWPTKPTHVLGADLDAHTELMDEIHRRLAHLSTQRVEAQNEDDPEGPFKWTDVLDQSSRVLSTFRSFVKALRNAHPDRAAWFDNSMRVISDYRMTR